tara:strand:- start:2699 stop:4135 length:1437 start_codon:yes stop_codon:yes gene_type:complete
MAEKGFGVKEINLIGASGTPTITSPNNINLNAANVAISTNVSIGGTMTITGGIDSVGLVTARSGIVVGAGKSINIGSFGSGIGIGATYGHRDISVVGFSTLSGGALVRYGGSYDMEQGPNNSGFRIVDTGSGYKMQLIYTSNNRVQLNTGTAIPLDIDAYNISLLADQSVNLSYNNSTKLQTSNTGVTVTGTLAATAVTGDGSGLTGISVTPTTSDIQVAYELLNTSSSSNGYRISGNGTNSSTNNPDLYLIRGQKYRFINNSGGSHPFRIQSDTSSTLYSTGVTNNGSNSGNIDFAPTYDSPAHLYYKCGSHPSMLGNIYISGGQYDTKPTNPIFFAFMDAQASHTSGDALKLDHTELNVGNGYNTSNYRFTPPVDGHYMFHGSANFSLSNGEFTRAANVRLYKNGSGLTYQLGRNSLTGYQSSYPQVDGTFMVHGTTSDYFTCVVTWETGGGNFSNLGSTENLHPHGTKFMGYFIG